MSSTPVRGKCRARAALVAALALTATTGAAQGCGFGEGETSEGEAHLTVTRDYGVVELLSASVEDPPATDTVMRFLDREAEIETRYGGGFVQSVDGLESTTTDGRRLDWFFYVDGVESQVGAAEVELDPGSRIWWDYHDWSDVMRVPAVVGSWPAPFAGSEPTSVPCAAQTEEVCREAIARIEAADGEVEEVTPSAARAGGDRPLVLVGAWEELRRLGQASVLAGSPNRSGVFARFEQAGEGWELLLYDQNLGERDRLGSGAGLVAAVEGGGEEPVWIVTGTDEEGARAAAGALAADSLENRFAVAIPAQGEPRALPIP